MTGKKLAAALCILAGLFAGGLIWAALPGDVNGDTYVDLLDAVDILNALSGNSIPAGYTEDYENYADTNGDGKVGLEDAVYVLRYIATDQCIERIETQPPPAIPVWGSFRPDVRGFRPGDPPDWEGLAIDTRALTATVDAAYPCIAVECDDDGLLLRRTCQDEDDTVIVKLNGGACSGVPSDSFYVPYASTNMITIRVEPEELASPPQKMIKYKATGIYESGVEFDITPIAQWKSSDVLIATCVNSLATTLNPGTTQISAALGGITGTTTLTVLDTRLRYKFGSGLEDILFHPIFATADEGVPAALVVNSDQNNGNWWVVDNTFETVQYGGPFPTPYITGLISPEGNWFAAFGTSGGIQKPFSSSGMTILLNDGGAWDTATDFSNSRHLVTRVMPYWPYSTVEFHKGEDWDSTGNFSAARTVQPESPNSQTYFKGVAFNSDGSLCYSVLHDQANNQCWVYEIGLTGDDEGVVIQKSSVISGSAAKLALSDDDTYLLFTQSEDDRVVLMDASTLSSTVSLDIGGEGAKPFDVVFVNDSFYVSLYNEDRIAEVNPITPTITYLDDLPGGCAPGNFVWAPGEPDPWIICHDSGELRDFK